MKEYISYIAVFAALVSAIGGLFSAVAAFKSANSASQSIKKIQDSERLKLLRNLSTVANAVEAESFVISSICERISKAYEDLGVLTGQPGGSRQQILANAVEEKNRRILLFQDEARNIIEQLDSYKDITEEELNSHVLDIEGKLVQIERLKEQLERELYSVEDKNRIFREKTITDT